MPWLVESFVAMPPELLREAARHGQAGCHVFHVISAARIAEILSALDVSALRPERADYREDTRLVIEFFDRAGNQTSYRANSTFLCNLKNTIRRRVDARFRRYFRDFQPVASSWRCSSQRPSSGRHVLREACLCEFAFRDEHTGIRYHQGIEK
jgi:hypothetical protein